MHKNYLASALSSLLIVAGFVASCGTDSTVSTDPSIDEFLNVLQDSACTYYVNCGIAPDSATCQNWLINNDSSLLTIRADVQAMRIAYNSGKGRLCLDDFKTLASGCDRDALSVFDQDSSCNDVFAGQIQNGGLCFFSEQCAPGNFCDQAACGAGTEQCCAGKCAPFTKDLAVGKPCNLHDTCAKGSFCSLAGGGYPGVCKAMAATVGAACFSAADCEPSLICSSDPLDVTGPQTCHSPVKTGSDCSSGPGNVCGDLRDYCDPVSKLCARKKPDGATCNASGTNPFSPECTLSSKCDSQTKTCTPLGKAGEKCDVLAGSLCAFSLQCDGQTGTCQATPPGKVCTAP